MSGRDFFMCRLKRRLIEDTPSLTTRPNEGQALVNKQKGVCMKVLRSFLWMIFGFLLTCQTCTVSFAFVNLGEIVITGHHRLIETPSALEDIMLDAGELSDRGISDLSTALQEVQGVDIYSSSTVSGAGAVSIRGLDSTYTQVMYNGIKMFDPISTTGYFSGYRYFPLTSWDKIEVLKGPYSSLYGSGGIGGNIHLTTRRGTGDPTWSYRQEIGSYQTFIETLKLSGEAGKLDFSFHVAREDVGGMYATRYKEGNHETDPLGITSFGGRLDYDVSDRLTIGGSGDFTAARYEYDGSSWVPPYNPVDHDSNVEKYYQGVGMLYAEHKVSDAFKQKLTAGGNRVYRKGHDSGADVWYEGVTQQVKYDGVWDLVPWDRFSFGADYLEENGESFWSTYNPKHRNITRGVFFQNLIKPLDGTRLVAGARLENHSSFGDHETYSIRAEQDIVKNGTVYVSYGTGFKAPSLYQLYAPTYGTRTLEPEETKSVEIGYDQRIHNFSFGQALFKTDIDDMIDFDSATSSYKNMGQVKSSGLELYGQYDFQNKAFVRAEYNFTDTEKKSTGARLFRRPENKLKIIGEIPWKKFTFRGDVSYVGNRIDSTEKLKPYYLANVSVKYQVNDHLKTFFRIENLLNQDYEIVDCYETKGFSVYGGFEVKF